MLKKNLKYVICFLAMAFLMVGMLKLDTAYAASKKLTVKSEAFVNNKTIPAKYAYDNENISIPLTWTSGPANTKSYAIIMYDTHKVAQSWVHWAVVNLPLEVTSLVEGASCLDMPAGSMELINSYGEVGYGGPCPPSGTGTHKYKIIIYALDTDNLDIPDNVTYTTFAKAVKKHTLASGQLTGLYKN